MNRFRKACLWLAVLPVAFLSGILSSVVLHLILYNTLKHFINPYPELPERLLTPLFFTCTFIYSGAYVAPKFKFATGVVLFSLLLFAMGGMIFLTWTDSSYIGKKLSFHGNGLASILGITGCFLSMYLCYQQFAPKISPYENIIQQPSVKDKVFTIVHVDDHQLFIDGVKNIIEKYGNQYHLISFKSISGAREYLRSLKDQDIDIDCILTGYNQPDLSGYEFASAVRRMYARPVKNSGIILFSMIIGNPEFEGTLKKWKEDGFFDAYLKKSASPNEVVNTIQEVIENRKKNMQVKYV